MPISLRAAVAGGLTFLRTSPTPGPGGDGLRPGLSADQVTPGFLGFAMTAFMVIAVVLLMVSMTRRIRRIRYRAQFAAAQPEANQSEEDGRKSGCT